MPTHQEYLNVFMDEADEMMSFPADTKVDVNKHAAEARRRVIRKREEFTKGITKARNDGFKRIKDENDQMQRDLRQAYKDADQMISERVGDQYVGLQR